MRRNDIHKVMIIGSGPIIIGQACEFDYSGTQACKALKKLGYEIFATRNTARVLNENGVLAIPVNRINEEAPTLMDLLLEHQIDLVIDTPTHGDKMKDGFLIRRTAIETGVNVLTSLDTANALLTSLENSDKTHLSIVDVATISKSGSYAK